MEFENLLLNVKINQVDIGDSFLLQKGGGYWISLQDITNAHIPGFEEHPIIKYNNIAYADLACDTAAIQCKVDVKNAVLHVTVKPDYFPSQHYQSVNQGERLSPQSQSSAFLNYSFNYNKQDEGSDSLSVPTELGIHTWGWTALTSYNYTYTQDNSNVSRLSTQLVKDFPDSLNRLRFGDFVATSGSLGSGGNYGGISFSKNYTLNPNINRHPGLDLSGVLQYPSQVNVYVDGQKVQTESLQPGQFNIQDIATSSGSKNVELVIRDPFGREHIIDSYSYVPRTLLKKGFSEYNYNYGLKRQSFNNTDFNYKDWAFIAAHRYGISNYLTTGLHTEVNKDRVNTGMDSAFQLGRWGEVNLDYAQSRDNNSLNGNAWLAAYSYTRAPFNISTLSTHRSFNYTTLNTSITSSQLKQKHQTGLSYQFPTLGGLGLRYRKEYFFNQESTQTNEITYNKKIIQGINFHARYQRKSENNENVDSFFLRLHWSLGNHYSSSTSHEHRPTSDHNNLSLTKSANGYTDYSLQAQVNENIPTQGKSSTSGFLDFKYLGQVAQYRAAYNQFSSQKTSYDLAMSGAISMIDGGMYWSRPIYDSFALVEVGIDDVEVKSNHTLIGKTGRKGSVLVPNITSYYPSDLSINALDIPINYKINNGSSTTTPYYRSGNTVDFNVSKVSRFWGSFFIVSKNKKEKPAMYKGLRIFSPNQSKEYILGKRGEFYIDDLSPGKYKTEIYDKKTLCTLMLTLPETQEGYADLGKLKCRSKIQ